MPIQQDSQIGTEEICGSGEPQRVQQAGNSAQPTASTGLRRTRATARQREVSEGGTSNVSEPESLRKTHLTWGSQLAARSLAVSIPQRFASHFERRESKDPRFAGGPPMNLRAPFIHGFIVDERETTNPNPAGGAPLIPHDEWVCPVFNSLSLHFGGSSGLQAAQRTERL